MASCNANVTTKVAAIQMCSVPNVDENLQQAELQIKTAAGVGAKLVVLPENFALLGVENSYQAGVLEAENKDLNTVRRWLSEMARLHQVWIIAGSIPVAACPDAKPITGRVRAACIVVNAQGEEVARYDKMHLFDADVEDDYGAYRESDTVEPGAALVVVDTPCGKVGLSICYDLRFPELYTRLREQGAEIITVPSAFTEKTGAAHWELLLRARAIETQCYLVAPNQTGQHAENRRSYGHSMIIDPWGEVLDQLADDEGVVTADVDLSHLQKVRKRMPVVKHRRLR